MLKMMMVSANVDHSPPGTSSLSHSYCWQHEYHHDHEHVVGLELEQGDDVGLRHRPHGFHPRHQGMIRVHSYYHLWTYLNGSGGATTGRRVWSPPCVHFQLYSYWFEIGLRTALLIQLHPLCLRLAIGPVRGAVLEHARGLGLAHSRGRRLNPRLINGLGRGLALVPPLEPGLRPDLALGSRHLPWGLIHNVSHVILFISG